MSKYKVLMGLAFVLAACSEGGPPQPAVAEPVAAVVSQPEPAPVVLSAGNAADISSDLQALNQVVNGFNTQSAAYRKALREHRWAPEQALAVMAQIKAATVDFNEALSAIVFKSKEVNEVYVAMAEGNALSIKLLDLTAKDELSAEDEAEIVLISEQALALQQSTGQALDALNAAHTPQ
ncbi:MAG: hypothetical protein KA214_07515 [Neisseriaceae bacterium]|nr:hypothetical protein [Neisseriaceae bacterium]